jgi:hypothetical protein
MESSVEIEARRVLVDRLVGARGDVARVVRYLDCCPLASQPVLPVLLAARDCLDEAIVRLGRGPPVEVSPSLEEPPDDRQ